MRGPFKVVSAMASNSKTYMRSLAPVRDVLPYQAGSLLSTNYTMQVRYKRYHHTDRLKDIMHHIMIHHKSVGM